MHLHCCSSVERQEAGGRNDFFFDNENYEVVHLFTLQECCRWRAPSVGAELHRFFVVTGGTGGTENAPL